jgi:hypothetical protein
LPVATARGGDFREGDNILTRAEVALLTEGVSADGKVSPDELQSLQAIQARMTDRASQYTEALGELPDDHVIAERDGAEEALADFITRQPE